ncbi:MAG: ABC transporter permease [Alteromonadaceae bacterium]|nr:ABC transporter permease [Alteromonadaceae bacterium]
MNYLSLFTNEAKLHLHQLKQYWFESVSSIVLICGMFIGLFYGIQSFTSDTGNANSLDGLVFGLLLWYFAMSAYGAITQSLIEDNQKGYIEQLFLCPMGFSKLMLVRALVEMISGVILMTAIAWITMALTGTWLEINFFYFYLLLFIAAFSLIGLGFIVSGLALIYKKVGTIGALFNIGFMGLVAIDALPINIFTLLPFTAGASLTREVILQGEALNYLDLLVVVANSAVYFFGGLFIFGKLEKRAKKLNLIGQY